MVEKAWRGAAPLGSVRAGDLIFALGRVAASRSAHEDSALSGTMLYVPGGAAEAMVWAGDGTRFALARIAFAASTEQSLAAVPAGFLGILKEQFERADTVELRLHGGVELLLRRGGAPATVAQPLWDPAAHIELYNAFVAERAAAAAVHLTGKDLLELVRDAASPVVLTATPDSLAVRSGGTPVGSPLDARAMGELGEVVVEPDLLADAIRGVVDVKHPVLRIETGELLTLRGMTRDGTIGDIEHVVRTGPQPGRDPAPAHPGARPAAGRVVTPPVTAPVDEVLAELDAIIGQDALKERIRRLQNQVTMNRRRQEQGLKGAQLTSHMRFEGPPGTGKTTVARLVARLYHALGVLERDEVLEVSRADLVSQNVGGTEEKTAEVIAKAMGGVLFIDEAYTLAQGGENDFGKKAIEILLKELEDKRDAFVCIVAGYTDEMKEFLDSNPGLPSRFSRSVTFSAYSADELVRIARSMARASDNLLTEEGELELVRRLADEQRRGGFEQKSWGNARTIRNIVESAAEHRDTRIEAVAEPDLAALMELTAADVARAADDYKIGHASGSAETVEDVLAELDAQIGQPRLKEQIRVILAQVRVQHARREHDGTDTGVGIEHLLFIGPPGTGKTTVARLVARLYRALGLLPKDEIVEVDRAALVSGYRGQTGPQTRKKIDEAMGGVLFIDEAYTLAKGDAEDPGKEAIDNLLVRMENDKGRFLTIAAGYPDDMEAFLASNVGLPSRFTTRIEFDPYTADELVRIGEGMAAHRGERLTDPARDVLRERLAAAERAGAFDRRDWGNARAVRNLVDRAVQQRDLRISDGDLLSVPEALTTLTEIDVVAACDIERIGGSATAETVDEVLAELDAQIGQAALKRQVRALLAQARLALERKNAGLAEGPVPLEHLIFAGPPGTGKTTIARLLGRLYRALGLLPAGTMVEVDRPALVGSHIGETEKRTRAKIDEAMGGILFIDEAYALARGGSNDFGKEAIDTLVPRLENDRGRFLAIAAGYPDDMATLLASNVGLASRFSLRIDFEPYTADELVQIAGSMAQKAGARLGAEARAVLAERLTRAERSGAFGAKDWGNARAVRNVVEAAMKERDLRLDESGYTAPAELLDLAPADVVAACDRFRLGAAGR